jgi:hypothetical protein
MSKMRQITSQIAYLLTANLWDSTKPKTLPTFDVQHPVNSTSTKSAVIIWQLPCINHNHSLTTPIMALTYPKQYKNNINLDIWNRAIIDFVNAKQ